MSNWREELNRLAIEFWCGVGDLTDVPIWADVANLEMGEVHPDVWDLYTSKTDEDVASILLKIANDVNGFRPQSWEAEPFAAGALQKALIRFLAGELSVQLLCKLITELDMVFTCAAPKDMGSPELSPLHGKSWQGNLWNCCDWCDDTWTFENSQPLIAEVHRVLEMLANPAVKADLPSASRLP
jgi:hypothetical protein